MNFEFKYKGKKIVVKDVEKCESGWAKFRGLMFRKDSRNLLFIFSRPVRIGIHSFFVRTKFLAIWLRKGKVIDAKLVYPWAWYVRPKKLFDTLLEVPFNSETDLSGFSSVVRTFKY